MHQVSSPASTITNWQILNNKLKQSDKNNKISKREKLITQSVLRRLSNQGHVENKAIQLIDDVTYLVRIFALTEI